MESGLIGKYVEYYSPSKYQNNETKGVILDKYTGTTIEPTNLASGKGGVITTNATICADYFIIRQIESDKIEHVLCNKIIKVYSVTE